MSQHSEGISTMSTNIITQDSTVSNSSESSNDSKFTIQVNPSISLSHKITKADVNTFKKSKACKKKEYCDLSDNELQQLQGKLKLGLLVSIKNSIRFWETVEVTIDELKVFIDSGHTIRGAVKQGGNSKNNVASVNTLYMDFDSSQSITETKNHPFSQSAFIIYPSPSFTEENQKHRLGFRLSRSVNVEESEIIYAALLDAYKQGDKSTKDAGRLFFGTALEAEILSYNAVLPVENFLNLGKMLKNSSEKKSSVQSSIKTLNSKSSIPVSDESLKQVDSHEYKVTTHPGQSNFFRKLDDFVFNEIFVGKYQGDINQFCCYYQHNFSDWVTENDKSLNWKGSNLGGDGTGLWVYLSKDTENALPCFNTSRDGQGHNWIWYAMEGGKYTGELPYSITMKGKDFDTIVGLFFSKHGFEYNRENFLAKRSDEEKNKLKKALYYECLETYTKTAPTYIKMCSWDKTAKTFLYYDIRGGKWDITDQIDQIFRCTIIPLLDSMVITPFNNEHELNYSARYFLTRCQVKEVPVQIKAEIIDSLKYDDIYPRVSNLIDLLKSRDEKIIPLSNGDFNNETGEFKPTFNPEINNQTRYSFKYKTNYSNDGIEALDNWLNSMYDHQDIRDLIKSWLVLNVAGIASKTERMVNIYGAPKTGKSTIMNLISSLLGNDLCYSMNAKKLNADNRFSFQSLEGKHAVVFDEFSATKDAWEQIKMLSGNSHELIIDVEHKGLKPYNSLFIGGITTLSQDNFKVSNADDGGVRRRLTMIYHSVNKSCPEIKSLAEVLTKQEIIESLFLWCIHQSADEHLKRFIDLAENSSAFNDSIKDVMQHNDKTLQFVSDCLEFTNDENDKIPLEFIRTHYEAWLESEGEHITDKVRSSFVKLPEWIVQKASIKGNDINWEFCPDPNKRLSKQTQMKYRGKNTRCFKGIKFKGDALPDSSMTETF